MTLLLIHLWVLPVRRLRVTAAVTIGTVVCIAVGGGILSHAFRKTWTLRAVLRSSSVARSRGLIPDGRKLRMLRRLTRNTDSLTHLTIDGGFARSTTLMDALLHIGSMSLLVSFACSFLFLLLCLPFLANFLKFCRNKSVELFNVNIILIGVGVGLVSCQAEQAWVDIG